MWKHFLREIGMIRKLTILIFSVMITGGSLAAEMPDLPAREYMKGFHLFGGFERLQMDFSMKVQGVSGIKVREMTLLMDRSDEDEKLLINIVEPLFLSNMKYLSLSRKGKENQWMKTSRGVRRLSSRNNSDSLFGSDFSVEDLSLTDLDNFNWSYTADQEGDLHIRANPLYESPAYSYKIFRIDTKNHLLKGVRYYDSSEKLVKEYTLLEGTVIDQISFPKRVEMISFDKGSSTLLNIQNVIFNPVFSDGVFNKGNL